MDFATIWNGENASSYILGNKKEHRQFIMSSGGERFVLPVTPWKYQVQTAQDNKIVEILDTGERLIFGNPKLKRLKFSCFFPAVKHKYPFIAGDTKETAECIALIEKWQTDRAPVRIIITDSPVNLQMAIQEFSYREKDGTRDIDYDLDLTEYRDWNTPSANNERVIDSVTGLKGRHAEQTASQISQFFKGAADVLEMSKFATGNFSNLPQFTAINNLSNLATRGISSVLKSGGWKF